MRFLPDAGHVVQAQMARAPVCMSAQWQPLVPSCNSMTPSGPSRCGALETRYICSSTCKFFLDLSRARVSHLKGGATAQAHANWDLHAGQGQVLGAEWAAVPARGQRACVGCCAHTGKLHSYHPNAIVVLESHAHGMTMSSVPSVLNNGPAPNCPIDAQHLSSSSKLTFSRSFLVYSS